MIVEEICSSLFIFGWWMTSICECSFSRNNGWNACTIIHYSVDYQSCRNFTKYEVHPSSPNWVTLSWVISHKNIIINAPQNLADQILKCLQNWNGRFKEPCNTGLSLNFEDGKGIIMIKGLGRFKPPFIFQLQPIVWIDNVVRAFPWIDFLWSLNQS
jgi:hypothetical protein